ncbi:MAG: ABC transporter substrate-binding protein [Parvularculaceae bacterium]|nr:ABC transporter substrate-binding protein [Parvularculaceae bacterium]
MSVPSSKFKECVDDTALRGLRPGARRILERRAKKSVRWFSSKFRSAVDRSFAPADTVGALRGVRDRAGQNRPGLELTLTERAARFSANWDLLGRALALLCLALSPLACGAPSSAQRRAEVVIGIPLEPPNLDPTAGAAAAIDEVVYANVFEGLTRIGPDGAVAPALAKSWSVSADGLVYEFELGAGVVFHDGTSFDADDVVFSFERARAPDSTNAQRGYFEPIESIEKLDVDRVRIRLKRPSSAFLFNLGQGDAVIVAPESAATNATNPVGTGPFRFAKWRRGDQIELERFDRYWGEAPKIARAIFQILSDPSAAAAALLAGDIDAFPNFPAPEIVAAFEANQRFAVVKGTTEGETILAVNNGRKPFDDLRVRRALCHAIDRRALIDTVGFGYGTPIGSHFAPHNPDYVDLTHVCPYDPARARALLAEAGLGGGFTAKLMLPPPGYARRGGEFVAAALGAVGVKCEIVNLEWAQWLKQVFADKDYDLTIVSHTEPMDIDIYARDDYYFQYRDEVFRALYARIVAATDPAERSRLLKEAQRKIAEDAVNVFLLEAPKIGVWNARLKGLWANSPIQANDVTGVYWSQGDD